MAEIRVPYGTDVALVRNLLRQASDEVRSDDTLNPHILAEPEVSGIEDLSGESLLFRVTVRVVAGQQIEVSRALRLACLTALTDAGVELVGAARMTVVAPQSTEPAAPNAATAHSIFTPTLRSIGRMARPTATPTDPKATAARIKPAPSGPACNMSRAKTGNIAVAPASNTANRSSVIVPSRKRSIHTKRSPSAISRSGWRRTSAGGGRTWRTRLSVKAEMARRSAEKT